MTKINRGIPLAATALVSVGLLVLAGGCSEMPCHHGMTGHSDAPTAKTADGKPLTFANDRCPIMGNAIAPAKVPASLVRDYNGQKIAFCCGGCPGAWDLLPASQKDAKLKAVSISH